MSKHFIANVGMNWLDPKTGEDIRVEAGERCDDVPPKDHKWLLEQGAITEVDEAGKPRGEE